MAQTDSRPNPRVDYGQPLTAAEEAACSAIDSIITDGGTHLWQHYLERKAFTFTADTILNNVGSQLKMCFVPFDAGEGDMGDGWSLEEEPEPGEIDSWARMHLPVRQPASSEDLGGTMQPGRHAKAGFPESRRPIMNSSRSARSSDSRYRPLKAKSDKPEPRSMPIIEETPVDEDEELLREKKAQEEARKRERERRAREAERQDEERRQRVEALHEEMARRPHTFDAAGNIIWVQEVPPDKLPRVSELIPFHVKRDPIRNDPQNMAEQRQSPQTAGAAAREGDGAEQRGGPRRSQRRQRNSRSGDQIDPEFPDGFSKLQQCQPPVLDTMEVQPGVVLETLGKRKSGPSWGIQSEGQLSRKQYLQLAEKEVERELGVTTSKSGAAKSSALKRSSSTRSLSKAELGGGADAANRGEVLEGTVAGATAVGGDGVAAATAAASTHPGSGVGSLPPLNNHLASRKSTASGAGGQQQQQSPAQQRDGRRATTPNGGGPDLPLQTAPPAPPKFTRMKKHEAVGNLGRLPRYHVARLGGASKVGGAQPPLGATMGHGLLRDRSIDEHYFFPAQRGFELAGGQPPSPAAMLQRSTSETSLVRPGGSQAPGGTPKVLASSASQGTIRQKLDVGSRGGRMRPEENSVAYRHFRSSMFPER